MRGNLGLCKKHSSPTYRSGSILLDFWIKEKLEYLCKLYGINFIKQVRTVIPFNTGTRIHKPKKGKGSYKRNKKVKDEN